MRLKFIIAFLTATLHFSFLEGQVQSYSINKASFSSDNFDEYSPVYYKNGLVYCTNRSTDLVSSYSDSNNKGLFKIFYVDSTGKAKWKNAGLFSKSLKSKCNDGPVSFSRNFDTIYYSRNLNVDAKAEDLAKSRNKLGVFYAVYDGSGWTKIKDLRINNEWYNVTTPCISPDGRKLFFASDKPGGYGGSDLYYCMWLGNYWSDPVNLGPEINTPKNEAYPFCNNAGDLFFSSDGHPGLGGKDIFYSRFSDTKWLTPVPLDPPINSKYDDFGLITDTLMNEGYFSSNRDGTLDIFHFNTIIPQIFYSYTQEENQYCFKFQDSSTVAIDTMKLKYVWDFGDGNNATGLIVNHCFSGTGRFRVRLDIVDKNTNKLFLNKLGYDLELHEIEQPYINAPEVSVVSDSVEFDGIKSHYPGFKILNYTWDFGDGTRLLGDRLKHSFKDTGDFQICLGLTLKSDSTGKIQRTGITKRIKIISNSSEKPAMINNASTQSKIAPDIRDYNHAVIKSLYSAESDTEQDVLYRTEIISSSTKLGAGNIIFSNVPANYSIAETYDETTGIFSYFVDQQRSLMATYNSFMEMQNNGFTETKIKMEILKDPAEKELNNIIKIFGISTDTYFDSNNKLTSTGYLMLDQVAKFMNQYPRIKLGVTVHTDNNGIPEALLSLSESYSQIIAAYLINKGVDQERLTAKGLGGSRPIASNLFEKDRTLNRRVDFSLIRD